MQSLLTKPGSTFDYKILQVTPDPRYNYEIKITDPGSEKEIPGLGRDFGRALRERLKKLEKSGMQN